VCNSLNLGAIFWERDLINGTGTHKCKIARDTTPESQECGCSGATLCRCRFGAALRRAFLLRLDIDICRIIAAVIALSTISGVTVVSTSSKDGARVGNERAELPKSCMWLCCGEVKDLATNLRVCACGITRCPCIDEWPWSTRRHAKQSYGGWRVYAESLAEKLARLVCVWEAEANHCAAAANCWHQSRVFRGRQDHVRAGWRLFERFKECVLRRLVHAVGALDERNAATPFNREEGEAGGEGANRLDADLIRCPSWRDDDEVGMAP
jgi:hypothetical protein